MGSALSGAGRLSRWRAPSAHQATPYDEVESRYRGELLIEEPPQDLLNNLHTAKVRCVFGLLD